MQDDLGSGLFAPKLKTELTPRMMQIDLSGLRIKRSGNKGKLAVAERRYANSALENLLGVNVP